MLPESSPKRVTRRICTSKHHLGPRWLPITYFYPKTRVNSPTLTPITFQSWCMTCQRIENREARGFQPRKLRMSPEERKKRKNESHHRRMQDPEYAARRREQQREYQRERLAAKRREQGIPARGKRKLTKRGSKEPRVMLPAEPLLNYLKTRYDNYHSVLSLNLHRRVIEAKHAGKIELGAADKILVDLGASHMLHELYPLPDDPIDNIGNPSAE